MELMQSAKFWLIVSFALGLGLILFISLLFRLLRISQAKSEASDLIADANEKAKELEDAAKSRAEAFQEAEWTKIEPFIKKMEDKLAELELAVKEKEEDLEAQITERESDYNSKLSLTDKFDNEIQIKEKKTEQKREIERAIKEDYIRRLAQKTEAQVDDVRKELEQKILSDTQVEMSRLVQLNEEESHAQAEVNAKKLLNLALNRFARPYCPERGISYLYFETPEQKETVLGPEQEHLRLVEKICGVDIVYDENYNAVSVYGFDPVRRSLGHACVERMFKERHLNLQKIEALVDRVKKDIFQKIVADGEKIAKELRIEGLDKEVKNMMGALKHRYSFTQNQYYHCGEVGFLTGLLGAELDIPIKDARRAGLLHDIGKAMDHAMDGGHAVIGADFIKQHGEEPHIVHAVRAHHFDETPSTDLAYVVIAADALSGARPGARRSTASTYTQKIQDLQTIATQFPGVIDTHILSAGREMRVYVDSKMLDDIAALKLSSEIAEKIEAEMSFPGQIKVTVVRQTQAIEYAR
jgi:ribonuclease Y